MEQSKKYQLNQQDLIKIGKGALIALAGVLLTYLSDMLPNIDFGQWTPLVVAFWSIVANIARKYLQDNT